MILDRPPRDWKRPAIPLSAQVQALKRALCIVMGCTSIEFDHRPPLYLRRYDTDTNDTIPSANDPAYIEAIAGDLHRIRTSGTAATSYRSDAHERAKTKRLHALWEKALDRPPMTYEEIKPLLHSRPLQGGKGSPLKKKLNGRVVKR